MQKNEHKERLFDEIIRYTLTENVEQPNNPWFGEEDLLSGHTFSDSFNESMERLFRQQNRREQLARIRQIALKIAAVVIVFVSMSLAAVMSVEALRENFLNLFSEKGSKSTTITFGGHLPEAKGRVLPTYLPPGYENSRFEKNGDYYFAIYKNNEGNEIRLHHYSDEATLGIDSEEAVIEYLTVNGFEAQYYEKNDSIKLLFRYYEDVFLIQSSLPKEQIVKIAESMKKIF